MALDDSGRPSGAAQPHRDALTHTCHDMHPPFPGPCRACQMERPARTVTRDHAAACARFIEPVVGQRGFLVALYGSTLTYGRGRDIDLLLVPWRPTTSAVIEDLLVFLDAKLGGPPIALYRGAMGTTAVTFDSPTWGLVDIQIRHQ